MRWPFKILGLLLIILFFVAVFSPKKPSPVVSHQEVQQNKDYYDSFEVKDIAEQAVKVSLKAPSTAKFIEAVSAKNKKGGWDVYGEVDAQNSYGAMLRSKYCCTMHRVGDKWKVDKIDIWQ